MKKFLSVVLMCVLALTMVTACGKKESTDKQDKKGDTSFAKIQDKGVLKIGLCPEYPPFESVNTEGKVEGFDADLATAIGKEMGVKVEFVNTPWEGLISGLKNGEFDMIMSAMSPEEATSATKEINMSDAYYVLNDVIAVKADNKDITKKEDLAGKVIGYQTGSAAEQGADKLEKSGIKVGTKNPYNRNSDAFAELENGRIDAVIVSYPYAVTQSKEDKNFKVINDPIQGCDLVAISVKGTDSLTKEYNKALKTLKDNGKYDDIAKKWLAVQE